MEKRECSTLLVGMQTSTATTEKLKTELLYDSTRAALLARRKESACNVGHPGSIPRLGRSPGEGNGNSLQYSRLENPMDRGAWWATVHGVAKSRTRLSD